jgi:hypothetical protein
MQNGCLSAASGVLLCHGKDAENPENRKFPRFYQFLLQISHLLDFIFLELFSLAYKNKADKPTPIKLIEMANK